MAIIRHFICFRETMEALNQKEYHESCNRDLFLLLKRHMPVREYENEIDWLSDANSQYDEEKWNEAKLKKGHSTVFNYSRQQILCAIAENTKYRKNAKPLFWTSKGKHLTFAGERSTHDTERNDYYLCKINRLRVKFSEAMYAITRSPKELDEQFPTFLNVGQTCGLLDCFRPSHLEIVPKQMSEERIICAADKHSICNHWPMCDRKSKVAKKKSKEANGHVVTREHFECAEPEGFIHTINPKKKKRTWKPHTSKYKKFDLSAVSEPL